MPTPPGRTSPESLIQTTFLMKEIEAGDGFNSLLRRHLQFGTSGKQQSREKRKTLFCGLNRWALISQTGTTVTVQLWKPPHLGPKNQTPENTGAA